MWTAFLFLVCLVRIVETRVTEQKSTTKDHDDNREDAKHYQLVILEQAQDDTDPIYQPVTFMRAPDPCLNIGGISFIKVCVAHYKEDGVKEGLQELCSEHSVLNYVEVGTIWHKVDKKDLEECTDGVYGHQP